MSEAGVERLFRGIWTFFAVLLVTLAVGFALGWSVQALVDAPEDEVVTTPDNR